MTETATPAKAKAGAKPKVAPPKPTIGSLIDEQWALREDKRQLETSIKALEEKMATVDVAVMEQMEALGIDKATGKHASVSITSSTVAAVIDWTDFLAYIYKNKYGHLLQRRVSDPAWRELIDAGKKVPGTEPFTKRKLNLRAL